MLGIYGRLTSKNLGAHRTGPRYECVSMDMSQLEPVRVASHSHVQIRVFYMSHESTYID